MTSSPKFKKGDMVQILPCKTQSTDCIGWIGTVIYKPFLGDMGYWRYPLDREHPKNGRLEPNEHCLRLIRDGDLKLDLEAEDLSNLREWLETDQGKKAIKELIK